MALRSDFVSAFIATEAHVFSAQHRIHLRAVRPFGSDPRREPRSSLTETQNSQRAKYLHLHAAAETVPP